MEYTFLYYGSHTDQRHQLYKPSIVWPRWLYVISDPQTMLQLCSRYLYSSVQFRGLPCHAMSAWYPCSYVATTGLQTCMLTSKLVWPSIEDPCAFAEVVGGYPIAAVQNLSRAHDMMVWTIARYALEPLWPALQLLGHRCNVRAT